MRDWLRLLQVKVVALCLDVVYATFYPSSNMADNPRYSKRKPESNFAVTSTPLKLWLYQVLTFLRSCIYGLRLNGKFA